MPLVRHLLVLFYSASRNDIYSNYLLFFTFGGVGLRAFSLYKIKQRFQNINMVIPGGIFMQRHFSCAG